MSHGQIFTKHVKGIHQRSTDEAMPTAGTTSARTEDRHVSRRLTELLICRHLTLWPFHCVLNFPEASARVFVSICFMKKSAWHKSQSGCCSQIIHPLAVLLFPIKGSRGSQSQLTVGRGAGLHPGQRHSHPHAINLHWTPVSLRTVGGSQRVKGEQC